MAKKLIIATNNESVTSAGRNAVTRYLESRGWSVWHWFEDLWLVSGVADELTINDIGKQLMDLLGGSPAQLLVMETKDSIPRMGYLPNKSIAWLKENWSEQ